MITQEEQDLINTLNNNLLQLPYSKVKRQFNILLGSVDAGKTMLLNVSNFIHIQTVASNSMELNIWYNNDAVFIELPEPIKRSALLLTAYLKQIKKYRKKNYIDNILLCINVYKAIEQEPKTFVYYLKQISSQLNKITSHYQPKSNLHIVFTHMDKIAGFCHSFDETTKIWGYDFNDYPNHASLLKQNTINNELLLKNLHETLLVKLHNSNDKLSKYLIREFPLQMESISNLVNACVNHLSISSISTSGVYFTCAKQSNSSHDRLTTNISKTYQLSLKSQIPQSSMAKPLFVNGMLKEVLNCKVSNINNMKVFNLKFAVFALSIIGVTLVGHHFYSNLNMNKAYKELSIYKQSSKGSLKKLLPALEHLSNANSSINKVHGIMSFDNLNTLNKQISAHYKIGLHENFLPRLVQQIVTVLNQSKKPSEQYLALKAYVMLGDFKKLDKKYIYNWFINYSNDLEQENKQRLAQLLKETFARPYTSITLNHELINNTRNYLNSLPKSFLYFQLLESKLINFNIKITLHQFNTSEIVIPNMYLKSNFEKIYNNTLPALNSDIRKDKYVLNSNQFNQVEIIKQQYLKNYQLFWQKISRKVMPAPFENYQQAKELFSDLGSNSSSIKKIFLLIQKNTQFFEEPINTNTSVFNNSISKNFSDLNTVSLKQLNNLQDSFNNLKKFFQNIDNINNKHQTAFEIAKRRFNHSINDPITELLNIEKQLPFPLAAWSKSIATNSWFIILKNAQKYINEQWQTIVYVKYQDQIKARFPFYKGQEKEVNEQNFITFFGYKGKLDSYFTYYIKPFIDQSTAKWQPKVKDDLQLTISKETIKELIRASIIRKMFFHKTYIQPSIKFTLHALSMEPSIEKLNLSINEQTLSETKDQKRSIEFVWPGLKKNSQTKLTIKNIDGDEFSLIEKGFWGWFKLLKKSELHAYNNDMTNFQLVINLNGNTSKFLMVANSPVNPFIPGVLENFKLPEKIV